MRQTDRVLVISSFDACDMYVEYFTASGLLAIGFSGPDQACQSVEAIAPAVIVTDITFLGSPPDGCEFIRRLRRTVAAATSIIVVTGRVREQDRHDAREAGADLFLIMPALPDEVLAEVRRALLLRRNGRRLPWNWPPALLAAPPFIERRHSS